MNIEKALQHQKWRLQNSKPTKKDVEAYNSILEWKELQEQQVLQKNESLAKLWIEKMILLSRTKLYDGKRCIEVINEILSKSVYEWCVILNTEIPQMRFNSVGIYKYPLEEKDAYNVFKMQERNKKIIDEFETELTEALKFQSKEEHTIKFVTKEINKIINTFEK